MHALVAGQQTGVDPEQEPHPPVVALQLTDCPPIAVNTGCATTVINMPISAPVMAAVAHTFARALVSAPIICPAAYMTLARITMSIAATGKSCIRPAQSELIAEVVELSCAKESATNDRTRSAETPFIFISF